MVRDTINHAEFCKEMSRLFGVTSDPKSYRGGYIPIACNISVAISKLLYRGFDIRFSRQEGRIVTPAKEVLKNKKKRHHCLLVTEDVNRRIYLIVE